MSVSDELDRFCADGRDHADPYSDDYRQLWETLGQASRSGKRFRSTLLMATHRAYGGRDVDVAARVAAGIELLHTAFVIHDDVIDKDVVRRGSPNVSGIFLDRARRQGVTDEGAATMGLTAGVLAGDLALVGATRAIALCGADGDTLRLLLDQVWEAVRVSAAGELDDVALGVGAATSGSMGDIIGVEERKTAVYSFQLPLQAGAVLAGCSGDTIALLGTVGRLAGIGFQLVDDLRGVFGEEVETGKSALGDLREGKRTALIAHAHGTAAWPEISQHLGDPELDDVRAETLRGLLEVCGSRAFVEELADSYLTTALQTAEDAGLESSLLGELSDLCRRIRSSAA